MTDHWTIDDVCKWLQNINLIDEKETFREQQIDGETLLGLTERMVEKLFPVMKHQVMFLRELEKLRNTSSLAQEEGPVPCDRLPTEPNTQYPNHKRYADVLGCLITRFPFLKDNSSSGYETLMECLRNKFKKERSPLVNLKTVQEIKQKFGTKRQRSGDPVPLEDIAGQERAKRRRENAIQISSEDVDRTREIVLDLEVVGEDELSFKEHISAINNELRRRQPDFLNIKDRMKRSLYHRVEHMGKPTEEVMEMFPFLQVPLLMHHEMRLRFGQDLELNLQDALNMMTPNILRVARSGNQRGLLSTLLGTETNKDLERSAAILILPILFKESSKFLCCLDEEPTSSFPTITFHDAENPLHAVKASVQMDGVTITSGEMNVPEALQCLLEVYFLFCVEYPKKLNTHSHLYNNICSN
ncbi:hypothetical protein UPYG_G00112010 [Umbra pygmaea]|uniref:SAM domain-containing protein n=1 Tax=Umbra pygmaea TaxID=75934 RepID=A0ABD0X3H3_UMBPY